MNPQKKVGLVLEGGSMRGMFTAGVLDTFMDEKIRVDGIIGVSAGALFGPNYFSKQRGRALRYNKRFCKDRRNMSFWNFLFTGNLVSKQFAYYDITLKYDLFDNETFMINNTGYFATATNIETGKALPSMSNFFYICEYLDITPEDFFNFDSSRPKEVDMLYNNLNKLSDSQFRNIQEIVADLAKCK